MRVVWNSFYFSLNRQPSKYLTYYATKPNLIWFNSSAHLNRRLTNYLYIILACSPGFTQHQYILYQTCAKPGQVTSFHRNMSPQQSVSHDTIVGSVKCHFWSVFWYNGARALTPHAVGLSFGCFDSISFNTSVWKLFICI